MKTRSESCQRWKKPTHGRANTKDPIMEQLRQCPEAFKVGEILGKAIDSFKYGQDEPSAGPILASTRRCHSPARLIGLPLGVSIARLKGVRWRYCTSWDEGPAAALGMSLLRLGICQSSDWSGSAVDFVERGFNRFCQQNGALQAKKVWVGDLRIADTLFELTEQERNQAEAGRDGATRAIVSHRRLRGSSLHPDRGDPFSP